MRSFRLKPAWLLALLLWLGLIVGGYAWLLRYSFAAGKASASPHTIPSSVASQAPSARPQLFLALHPRCPCSRATLSELATILSRAPEACGVTASRGHEGDNAAKQAVIQILRGQRDSQKSMPVFGCPIQPNPTERYSL